MNIKIGEKIKELRKKHNVTQDKFAEYLGVTPQAVSRWENEDCYPDVDLFPAIANFFSITIDELFESDRTQKRQKELSHKIYKYYSGGYLDDAIALARKALKEFPNNYDIIDTLSHVLFMKDKVANKDEIISLSMRILDDSGREDLRYGVLQTMAFTYSDAGEHEKAKEIADKCPSIWCTRISLLSRVTKGEDKIKYTMEEIQEGCQYLTRAINSLARQDYDFGGIPKEKLKIMMYEKSLQIYNIIFDDGNLGFFNISAAQTYMEMAENYILLTEYEKAFECLEKASDYSISYEKCAGDESKFTAMLASKITNPPGHMHSKPSNLAYDIINDELLKKDVYSAIREDKRFKAIIDKLSSYAKAEQYEVK